MPGIVADLVEELGLAPDGPLVAALGLLGAK